LLEALLKGDGSKPPKDEDKKGAKGGGGGGGLGARLGALGDEGRRAVQLYRAVAAPLGVKRTPISPPYPAHPLKNSIPNNPPLQRKPPPHNPPPKKTPICPP
jgi:hypothetical protein